MGGRSVCGGWDRVVNAGGEKESEERAEAAAGVGPLRIIIVSEASSQPASKQQAQAQQQADEQAQAQAHTKEPRLAASGLPWTCLARARLHMTNQQTHLMPCLAWPGRVSLFSLLLPPGVFVHTALYTCLHRGHVRLLCKALCTSPPAAWLGTSSSSVLLGRITIFLDCVFGALDMHSCCH
jgi:hypothetical protein